MSGVTLSVDEIEAAPPEVRRWLESETARTLGLRPQFDPETEPTTGGPTVGQAGTVTIRPTETPAPMAKDSAAPEQEVKMDTAAAITNTEELRKLIAERAYELWENQGRPQGCDLSNWRQAEQEIMNCVADGKRPDAREAMPAQPTIAESA